MKQELIYTGFERFWHWTQAVLVGLLALTGFEIHGTYVLLGYRQAVALHTSSALGLLVLIAFAAFWHATTGEWRQYLPTREKLRAQALYYVSGMFRGEPHPVEKQAKRKLNPLQRLVYLGLKIVAMPLMAVSGVLYLLYRYPNGGGMGSVSVGGLRLVAVAHTAGAFALVAFLVSHVYLTTTGRTVTSNLKAMLTGWEEME